MGDPLDRILEKLDGMSQRLVAVEVKQGADDAENARLRTLERDVNGIGRKVDLHETSPGHGVMLARLEAIETALGEMKEWRATRQVLEAHIASMNDRQRREWFQTAALVVTLGGLLWKVYAG